MINKVTLIGRLGKDPEVRRFDNNSSVCNFTIATSESYTDKEGNRIEQTEWHNLAIWRKGLVDVAEKYLKKGHLVYIEGKLRTRNWDDQDGNKRYTTEVVVDNFKMLERRENTATSGDVTYPSNSSSFEAPSSSGMMSGNSSSNEENDINDDLPF
ncbi:MAG: single-stranded DNA-binding protein [Chitinophagales bacterium]|nr:single-stranded DNA-binding protein [Bacteroidota bacterium]MCB9255603.1 single-stranded DNA-binding protein [Chitinophagales bacterium]